MFFILYFVQNGVDNLDGRSLNMSYIDKTKLTRKIIQDIAVCVKLLMGIIIGRC